MDYLGERGFCKKCKFGQKKWKSVFCTNNQSSFNKLKVNSVLCAPCFTPKRKED